MTLKDIIRPIFTSIICLFPKLHSDYIFIRTIGRTINWKNPRDLNEWIHWLSLYSDTSEWTNLSDKYRVRDFVTSRGFSDILVPLISRYDNAEDIDFDSLPSKFVIRTNNGSGDTIIVKDKDSDNRIKDGSIRRILKTNLKRKYGLSSEERHYLKIVPCIVCEKLLDKNKQSFESTSLIDYKLWFVNGEFQGTFVIYDRTECGMKIQWRDINWVSDDSMINEYGHYIIGRGNVPKPETYDDMIRIGKELSQGFPQVRVDFYEVDGKLYFGEMTFTSNGGNMRYLSNKSLKMMGDKISRCISHKY